LSSPLKRARETAAATASLLSRPIAIEPRIGEIATPAGVADRRAWLAALMGPDVNWSDAEPSLRAWRDDVIAAIGAVTEDTAMFSHFVAINVVAGLALAKDAVSVCTPALASICRFEVDQDGIRLISGAPLTGDAGAT
jgi:broad specificity phosphatase PhoE